MRWLLFFVAGSLGAVDFATDVHPILASRCLGCHSGATPQGGFSLATREGALKSKGEIVARVKGEAGLRMPPTGKSLDEKQIAILEAWVKEDLPWTDVSRRAARTWQAPLEPRAVALPASDETNPIDKLLDKGMSWRKVVPDAVFVRRVYLDLWGITPTPEQLRAFDGNRAKLVEQLLADRKMVTGHWISFWNDLLRDDLRAYHGGEKSIRPWLVKALNANMPYDQMVRELVNPVGPDSPEGFLLGINWRGDVNASQRPMIQAAQNTAQVFLGVNLKCASCHDSFINHYKLKQAYGMAALFSEERELDLYRCDVKTGEKVGPQFLFPAVGPPVGENRRADAAALFTRPKNGRLARTFVNRIWAKLFGRGIVEPVDDMDAEPFNADLLDWLAVEFARDYDIHRLVKLILTSRAWQQPAEANLTSQFRGPLPRRLTAEQVVDTLSAITGEWRVVQTDTSARFAREWEMRSTALTRALGRPMRDQVITTRNAESSTLQALELVNGTTIHQQLRRGAQRLVGMLPAPPPSLWDSAGLRREGKRPFEVQVRGPELHFFVDDIGSFDPERTVVRWLDVQVDGKPLSVEGKLGAVVKVAIPPGEHRLTGALELDVSGKQSDINSAVRGYIFPSAPDRNLLARITDPPPVPLRKPAQLIDDLFLQTLGRAPAPAERQLAQQAEVEDLLWILLNHPEFQYVD
jgi:mono/diheme cytochrome c family protein